MFYPSSFVALAHDVRPVELYCCDSVAGIKERERDDDDDELLGLQCMDG